MTPAEIGREFARHLKRGINLELPERSRPTYLKAYSAWMADLSNLCSFARAEEPDDEEVDRLIAASECLDAFAQEVVA